jgi:hypothetical protein
MRTLLMLLAIAAIPVIAFAATSDDYYRDCMRGIVDNSQERIIAITRNYHRNWDTIISDRKLRYIGAWNISNDNDRRNILRTADKEVNALLRDNDKTYKEELKAAQNDFRAEEKRCNDELKQRDKDRRNVNVGRRCYGTDECSPPAGICTVEFGDCRRECNDGNCRCSGICVLR